MISNPEIDRNKWKVNTIYAKKVFNLLTINFDIIVSKETINQTIICALVDIGTHISHKTTQDSSCRKSNNTPGERKVK